MKKITLALTMLFVSFQYISADEGMWLLENVGKKVRSYSNAVVSIDFMGTGSIISDQGLVITNHHVAYADIFALSTKEHNYLEDGFWARSREEEIPVKGRSIEILREQIDVTAQVQQLIADGTVKEGPMMMRRLGTLLEKEYEQNTGLTASLGSFWNGCKYYISLYEVYSDIRLVAAPPVSVSAFGGDVDNWEWPQQKCDFAMYRIYTAPDGSAAEYSPENVPLKPRAKLKISTKGYKSGSQTIVIGYPGSTDRYASSAKVDYMCDITLPIASAVRGRQMEIISRWMNESDDIRLKYADYFFSLSNVQELYEGELLCYKRFAVADEKRILEKELQEWIDADQSRKAEWGDVISLLKKKYEDVREADRNLNYFRESMIRGTRLMTVASRVKSLSKGRTPQRVESTRKSNKKAYEAMDMRVEHDILRNSIEIYFENVDKNMWGPYQKELKERFGSDYDALCDEIWNGSWLTDSASFAHFLNPDTVVDDEQMEKWTSDKLVRFFDDAKFSDFNDNSRNVQGDPSISELGKKYVHALYYMRKDKGVKQYPNANSTLRVSFGKVGGYSPKNALWGDYKSTAAGILEKHNPAQHDFCLKDEWKTLLENADSSMPVNFLSDNDITGGNSGSPVLNSKGELIGLAFDGNKESLASNVSFTPLYNRCVNVDIRYVIWTLRNYGKMDEVLAEIGL